MLRTLTAIGALLLAAQAHAGPIDLVTTIGGANLFAFHNFTGTSSDVEGAIVAGGNVTLTNYAVNANNKDAYGPQNLALVARGDLKLNSGSINNGQAYAGGTASFQSAANPGMAASAPLDFDLAMAYYRHLSGELAGMGATGTVAPLWSGVKVTGSGKGGVDVFNVSADLFRNSSSWTLLGLTPGQTLIFNISGSNVSFNDGGISFEPLSGYNVLFNMYEATNANVKGVIGSVLAPGATVDANWGVVNGNVIVDTWNSTIQVNSNHYFKTVDVPGFGDGKQGAANVPEPGTIALVLGGVAAVAAARRRRVVRAIAESRSDQWEQ